MKIKKETFSTEIINLIWISIGCLVFVIGINLFLTPAGVYTTGLLGLSQELSTIFNNIFGTPDITSILYLILNIPAILLGWFKVGKKFTLRTFFAVFILSIFTAIIPNQTIYITDTLLAIITAGLLCGVGIGITLKHGSSTGGVDIVALFISLFKGKSFGVYNIALNSIVVFIAIILNNDITTGVFMLVSLYVTGVIVDKVHTTNDKYTLYIVTSHFEEVRETLLTNFIRGLTIFESEGGKTQLKNKTIMTTIEKGELYSAIDIIKNADENAFITILKTEKVVGAFENNYLKIL